MVSKLFALVATAALFLTPFSPAAAASGSDAVDNRFLSPASSGDPATIALDFLLENPESYGLTQEDFEDLTVANRYVSKHNGVTHLYFQQRLDGVEIYNGLLNVNVMPDGRIVSVGNRWVGNVAGAAADRSPTLSAEDAVSRAALHLRIEPTEPLVLLDNQGGPAREVLLSDGGISLDDIPARLVYQKIDDGSVRLAWNVTLRLANLENWWNLRIDAATGDILDKNDWIARDSYRVVPLPFTDPEEAAPSVVTDPADASASPFGWHDTNGAVGPEFTDTRGNNVFAQEDTDANNSGGTRPASPTNDYDFAFDPNLEPDEGTNQEAAIVNLFYWNNIVHDVMWHYGFDEPGGNFQENNYGNGGLGGDPVDADAQDGSGTNNANFATPSDGNNPRMQMFIWTPPFPNFLTVNSPGTIAGDYEATGSNFGPQATVMGTTADTEVVNDGAGASNTDGCEALVGFTSGNIALIDRGSCNFTVKVANAQAAGAVAAIIMNNAPGNPTTLGGTDPSITIPSGMISQDDGAVIRNEPGTVNATFRNQGAGAPPNRDSDFDSTVIVHEYGHGISNRLTGGPGNSGCLNTQEQMGEGWSDWYGLAFTAEAADTAEQARGIAPYLRYQPPTGAGIRRFPYSTDMVNVNPDTFSTISAAGVTVPHGVGSVWAAMIWDMYWNLVDAHGFNTDFYGDWTTGGNNRAIQLVTDGLKFQPCNPGFVDGRDAILAADLALSGGEDFCRIWNAFARRGLGTGASSGSVNTIGDETESFDVPAECLLDALFFDGFESGDVSAWSGSLP